MSFHFDYVLDRTAQSRCHVQSAMYLHKLIRVALLAATAAAHFVVPNDDQDMSGIVVNRIPYSTRVKYMRLVFSVT